MLDRIRPSLTRRIPGAHPETRAFFDAYQRDLVDDNDEFANLRLEDVVMGSDNEVAEEEQRETISYDDIRRELREAAQQDDVGPPALEPISIIDCALLGT
jgi:mediator of replication checkpoint protein 1